MGVALAAETHDRHLAAGDEGGIGVTVVENLRHWGTFLEKVGA